MNEKLYEIQLGVLNFLKNIVDSLISVVKILIQSKFFIQIPKATQPVCSILGNGPSLRQTLEKDIDFLKKTELFCLNHFVISNFYSHLKPKNYLLLDPAFINIAHEPCQNSIDLLIEKTTWQINLFMPTKFKKVAFLQEKLRKNSFIQPVYYNYTIVRGFDFFKHFVFRKNLGMPQSQNVLIPTLFYALNMDFKEIYLFGADHSWHEEFTLDNNNQIVGNHKHFYDSKTYYSHQNMNKVGYSYMSRQFSSLHKAFHGYEVLAKYADSRKIKVFNASVRSYIDVFEKVKVQ